MSDQSEGEPAHKKSKKEKQPGFPPGEGKADSSPLSTLLVTLLWSRRCAIEQAVEQACACLQLYSKEMAAYVSQGKKKAARCLKKNATDTLTGDFQASRGLRDRSHQHLQSRDGPVQEPQRHVAEATAPGAAARLCLGDPLDPPKTRAHIARTAREK
eukprot:g10016.t1